MCVTISKSVDGPNMLPKLFKAKDDSCKSSYGLYGTVKGKHDDAGDSKLLASVSNAWNIQNAAMLSSCIGCLKICSTNAKLGEGPSP